MSDVVAPAPQSLASGGTSLPDIIARMGGRSSRSSTAHASMTSRPAWAASAWPAASCSLVRVGSIRSASAVVGAIRGATDVSALLSISGEAVACVFWSCPEGDTALYGQLRRLNKAKLPCWAAAGKPAPSDPAEPDDLGLEAVLFRHWDPAVLGALHESWTVLDDQVGGFLTCTALSRRGGLYIAAGAGRSSTVTRRPASKKRLTRKRRTMFIVWRSTMANCSWPWPTDCIRWAVLAGLSRQRPSRLCRPFGISMLEAKDGVLWSFGSRHLARFDGQRWERF